MASDKKAKKREYLVDADVHAITRVQYRILAESVDEAAELVASGEGETVDPQQAGVDLHCDDLDIRTVTDPRTGRVTDF